MVKAEPEENLCAKDQEVFRRKAARLQFFQSVFQGIGGALLFGMVSSLVLSGGMAIALPVWAMVAIPLAGISSIFIGTRCGIESQLLSQSLSAKLMGNAVKPGLTVVAAEPEQAPAKTLPPGMQQSPELADPAEEAPQAAEKPSPQVHAAAAIERVAQPAQVAAIH